MGHPDERNSLLERLDGRGFVVFHVEDSVELRDLEQIVHLFGEVQQFEFTALVLGVVKALTSSPMPELSM